MHGLTVDKSIDEKYFSLQLTVQLLRRNIQNFHAENSGPTVKKTVPDSTRIKKQTQHCNQKALTVNAQGSLGFELASLRHGTVPHHTTEYSAIIRATRVVRENR